MEKRPMRSQHAASLLSLSAKDKRVLWNPTQLHFNLHLLPY
jgi:hypothetical protein